MSIRLEGIRKRYGRGTVLDRVSLEIADRELFVLLGTSGSGKSTVLRVIAGLAPADEGRVLLDGQDVTRLPPQQRGVGFVFQNYSIFRHMSVGENIEFGLKIRGRPASERAQRREELLDLVGLGGYASRYAHQLSGGQQQRVALARALAYAPRVLLLDEPFGALDARTRGQLRRSLREVQHTLGVTTILVTHDQEEAFELADRIGVLDRGRLLEVGEPEALYRRPGTSFAATFVGGGTLLVGQVKDGQAHFGPLVLPIPPESPHEDGASVQLLIRPEQAVLMREAPPPGEVSLGSGRVVERAFGGPLRRARIALPHLAGVRQLAPIPPFGEERLLVETLLPSEVPLPDEELWVKLRGWHILQQPEPRLLIVETGDGASNALVLGARMAAAMPAQVMVLGTAPGQDEIAPTQARLAERAIASGIDNAEVKVRVGEVGEAAAAELHEALYAAVIMAPERSRTTEGVTSELPAAAAAPVDRRGSHRSQRLGDALEGLLLAPSIPVLVASTAPAAFRRILICTAVGEAGKHSVRIGGWIARRLGAAVTLLHVLPAGREPGPVARAHLTRAAATLRAMDVEADVLLRKAARPSLAIIEESRSGAYDLMIIGHHGAHHASMFGRDDVMLQVLTAALPPVLVVPGPEA